MVKGSMKRTPASLPQVASFECSNCGSIHNSRDAQVPVGWTQSPGALWCGDCTAAGIASRQISRRARASSSTADKVRLRGEVLQLLEEGRNLLLQARLAPDWVDRCNALVEQMDKRAA